MVGFRVETETNVSWKTRKSPKWCPQFADPPSVRFFRGIARNYAFFGIFRKVGNFTLTVGETRKNRFCDRKSPKVPRNNTTWAMIM